VSALAQTEGGILIPGSEDFSPALIFGCGQCFRFDPVASGVYRGVAFGQTLTVAETARGALLDCSPAAFETLWRDYFDLSLDYGRVRQAVSVTAFMAEATAFGRGIRILRQDFWEALCSFVLSQCNNIPRIKGLIQRLCTRFGETIPGGGHAFPRAETVARLHEDDLRALGAGYRARYLLAAARTVAEGRLDADVLYAAPYDEARRALLAVEGIGGKVADCALLYGLHRIDAFPVDVWMRRALTDHFPKGFDPAAVFGPYAGIAQQYIFHYVRHLHGKAETRRMDGRAL
jgi:N-glycosylase/DNA lyase